MKVELAKKASITLPASLERALKKLSKKENRSLSGLIQEATKYYLEIRQYDEIQKELSLKAYASGLRSEEDIDKLIHNLRNQT